MRKLVIIPTYNERENIAAMIETVMALPGEFDLLIIDDLGTEVTNQFTTSVLYNIVNTRLNHRRATIISTNLSQDEFRRRYYDRITSRVLGEYTVLPFLGQDIRAQKLARH